DLIGFLNDCDSVLRDDGVLSLAVPDKRRCFDYFRPMTGLAKVLDHHFQKCTKHTPGTIIEHNLNFCTRDNNSIWNASTVGGIFRLGHSLEQIVELLENVPRQE